MKTSIKDFFTKYDQSAGICGFSPTDLVTFTEEVLNGNLHFLCCALRKKTIFYLYAFSLSFVLNCP